MNNSKEIKQIICKWNASIENYGKLDAWQLDKDLAKVDNYVSMAAPSSCTNALRRTMYFATTNTPDIQKLRNSIQTSIKKLSVVITESQYGTSSTRSSFAETLQFATRKLYNEKVRFKDNRYLRNIDTNFEDGDTTRKVRRIVEKRMSQAYYRTRKGFTCNKDRKDKVGEQRAISFQMRNLGQIDITEGSTRTDATHWKKTVDQFTGKIVMKPKKIFDTYDEAAEEANKRNLEMNRKGLAGPRFSAYKCAYCGKYHIGHKDARKKSSIAFPASAERNLYDGFTLAS